MTEEMNATSTVPDEPGFFVLRHYLADLSVENPIGRLPESVYDKVGLDEGLHVDSRPLEDVPDAYQVEIYARLTAAVGNQVFFVMEMKYRVEVQLHFIPAPVAPQILEVDVPQAMLPMIREIFEENGRLAGYPELKLNTLDFAGLFQKKNQPQDAATAS